MVLTRKQCKEVDDLNNITSQTDMSQPGNSTVVQMSADQLQQLLAGIHAQVTLQVQQAQQEFRQQLEEINSRASTPASQPNTANAYVGNFVKCTSRFSGKGEDVSAFIDAIETFKDCASVSDANALRGLPMLLTDGAAVWFQGVKETIQTWQEAVEALRASYGPDKPPYQIYRELFSREQKDDESTDVFISHARSLISKLKEKPSETIQLDMIYGLINRRVRKRVLREDITSFEELLRRARTVERSLLDCNTKKAENSDKKSTKNNQRSNDNNKKQRERPRCTFCARFGHTFEDCRNRQNEKSASPTAETQASESTTPQVVCYGCGAPGQIRSRCMNCNKGRTESTVLNCVVATKTSSARPMIPINIYGRPGVACADSGAQVSIAGRRVYDFLRSRGEVFAKTKMCVTLADGITREMDAVTVQIPVKVADRVISCEFIALPEMTDNKTLLGIDFLQKADIVINVPGQRWCFSSDPSREYAYASEQAPEAVAICAVPPSTSVDLREDEGCALTVEQRRALNDVLRNHEAVFRPGGEPTDFVEHVIETGGHRPVSVPPYRLSQAKKDFLRSEIDRMLADGIIEECESPWGFPVVLVPKKTGSFRLCVDYRKLNAITVGDSYPLPRIEDLLHSAKRAAFMSTLDLQCGYWQVRVREVDKDKTCFVCPLGTFRFFANAVRLKKRWLHFSALDGQIPRRIIQRYPGCVLGRFNSDFRELRRTFRQSTFSVRKIGIVQVTCAS